MTTQPDFLSPYACAHCGKHGATVCFEVQGPDVSWRCFRYWCSINCHARWSTNQPKPVAAQTTDDNPPIASGMVDLIARRWLAERNGDLAAAFPTSMRFDTLDQFLNCIRSTIAVMREPTDAMIECARGRYRLEKPDPSDVHDDWQAMIDAALSDRSA